MSLLNQVLQDLDARDAEVPAKSVLTAVDNAPSPNLVEPPGRNFDWKRIAVWGSLALLVVAYLVYVLVFESVPAPEPGLAPATMTRVVAATDEQTLETPGTSAPGAPVETLDSIDRDAVEPLQTPVEVASVSDESVQTTESDPSPSAISAGPAAQPVAREPSTPAHLVEQGPVIRLPPAPRRSAPVDRKPLVAKRSSAGTPVLAPASWLAEAKRFWAQGRIASAEERLRKALTYRPQDLAARELLIALLVRGDRLEEAEQQIDLGLLHHPEQASLLMLKARLQAQRGEVLAAAATLEQSGLAESGDRNVLAMLAPLYQQLGNHRQSVAVYRQLLQQAPNHGVYWAGLGLGLEALGETGMALQAYQRALDLPALPDSVADYLRERRNLLE